MAVGLGVETGVAVAEGVAADGVAVAEGVAADGVVWARLSLLKGGVVGVGLTDGEAAEHAARTSETARSGRARILGMGRYFRV